MSQLSCKTHPLQERYYNIYRVIFKILGLWPYQESYLTRLHKVLFASILLTFLLAQLLVFITKQYNATLLLKIFLLVFPLIFVTIKYITFIIQANDLKQLLEQIQNDWNLLKDKLEIEIIEKYACNMRLFTIAVIVYCYLAVLLCTIFEFFPLILNVILPLNESRPFRLIATTEYFVNQEKYIYCLMLHELLTGFVGSFALCGTCVIIVMYIMHACALLKIASCRIENAIEKSILAIPSPRKECLLHWRIVHAVVMHQRATEYTDLIISTFAKSFVILIIIGVSSLSFNLFQFCQFVTLMDNRREAIVTAVLVISHLIYMFILNYAGQELINHGLQLFQASYNGLWYAAPLHTQKLLLFIMQRGRINIVLTCGKIFVASLEGFATLTSTAISYFTVIYSMRQ